MDARILGYKFGTQLYNDTEFVSLCSICMHEEVSLLDIHSSTDLILST